MTNEELGNKIVSTYYDYSREQFNKIGEFLLEEKNSAMELNYTCQRLYDKYLNLSSEIDDIFTQLGLYKNG